MTLPTRQFIKIRSLPRAPEHYDQLEQDQVRRMIELAFVEPGEFACCVKCGTGSPEGVVTSPVGCIYEQTDAASTTHSVWVKRTGTGNTGWHAWAGLRGGPGTNTTIAIGDNATSPGLRSIAIGESSSAAANDTVAMGNTATASRANGIAIGDVTAGGTEEINIGLDNINAAPSTDARNVFIGQHIRQNGSADDVIIIGNSGIVTNPVGSGIIVIGGDAYSVGSENMVVGQGAGANAANSPTAGLAEALEATVIGPFARANGSCVVAVGHDAIVRAEHSIAIGPHTQACNSQTTTGVTAVGRSTLALAHRCTALGADIVIAASHRASLALGFDATTNAANQCMIGSAAENITALHFNNSTSPAMTISSTGVPQFAGGLTSPSTSVTTTPFTVTLAHSTLLFDATSGAIVANLPAAATVPNKIYYFAKIDSSANTITIDPNGSETINGATTAILSIQYDNITIQSNGSNWIIIG